MSEKPAWRHFNTFLPYAFFAFLLLWCMFILSPLLGLYEDDFTFATFVLDGIKLTTDRPLVVAYRSLIAQSWFVGGIHGLYFAGFFIIWIEVSLYYFLIKRLTDKRLAFIAALFFIVYPADGTRIETIHVIHHGCGILFILSCYLYYLGVIKKRLSLMLLSSVMVIVSALMYEIYLLPSVLIPSLVLLSRKNLDYKRLLLGTCAYFSVIILFTIAKKLFFAGRLDELQNLSFFSMLHRMAEASVIGFTTSVFSYFERFYILFPLSPISLVFILASGMLFLGAIAILNRDINIEELHSIIDFQVKPNDYPNDFKIKRQNPPILLAFTFLVGWAIHYLPYITPNRFDSLDNLYGRISSTHIGAEFFSSFVVAFIFYSILKDNRSKPVQFIGRSVLITALSVYAFFHYYSTLQLAHAFENQKSIWRQIIGNTEDAKPQSFIVVKNLNNVNKGNKYIHVMSWDRHLAFRFFFKMYSEKYPAIISLSKFSKYATLTEDSILIDRNIHPLPGNRNDRIALDDLIYLDFDETTKTFKREFGPIQLQNGVVIPKAGKNKITLFKPPGILYETYDIGNIHSLTWKAPKGLDVIHDIPTGIRIIGSTPGSIKSGPSASAFLILPRHLRDKINGKEISIHLLARKAQVNGSDSFAMTFTTEGVETSGWKKFDIDEKYREFSFPFVVKDHDIEKHHNILKIAADTGNDGRVIEISSAWIELTPSGNKYNSPDNFDQ